MVLPEVKWTRPRELPEVEVQGYFVDFEGIWDADIGTGPDLQEATVA